VTPDPAAGDDADDTDDADGTDETDDGTDEEGYTTDDSGVTVTAHGGELLASLNLSSTIARVTLDPDGPDYEEGCGQTVVTSGTVSLGFARPFMKPVGDPIEADDMVLAAPSTVPTDAEGPDVVPLDDSPEPIVFDGPTGGNPIAATAELALAEPTLASAPSLLAWSPATLDAAAPLGDAPGGREFDGELLPPEGLGG
jgi:hypothetical protein